MAMLTVGLVAVPMSAASPPTCTIREIGDYSPAWNGTDLGVIVARKKTFGIATAPMTMAAANTLEAAILATPPVECYGDILGDPPLALPGSAWYMRGTVTGRTYVSVPGGFRVALAFTLTQI